MYAGQYFQRYYDTFEGEYWVEVADGTFQYQLNASKPHCDCNTYQWHTLNHTLTYCMARPDLSYFTSGNARLNAEYGIMMMNNLGYQVPNGDIGGWGPIGAELRILRMAEWFYREGLYQWALDRKAQIRPQPELSSFSMPPDHPAVEPAHLLGAQGWALDELWYNSFGGPDEVALESAIDKISFRESFDPDAGYLLLDGLTRGGHGHMDANAILQWTENGRVWLADVDYIKSLPKYHNSMLVLRDGQSAPLPGYCELQNLADFETVGASQTVLRNYAGVDWHRGVIQLKGRAFVVVDRLVAREPGDYSFRAVWRTLGNTELDGATWQVEQDGQHAAIVMTADTRCIVTPDEYTSKNWSSYPWVDDALVLSMQGIVDARLEPGEQVTMFTVLHASGEEPSPVQVRRLSREMIAITGLGDPVIVAAGDRDGRIVLPGAATMVGELVTMTPTHICAVGVTQAEALGQSETREGGADAEANIAAGTVQVRSPMAATVGATQTVEVMDLPMQATSAEVAGLMNMIIAAASPVGRPASVVGQLPELAEVWSYVDMPQDYLLTGNPGPPESVQAVEEVSVTPEPLEANVFSRTAGDNLLRSIFDGRDSGTSDAVMWDDGQEVTINLRLHDSYDLHGMNLRAWFATESSKDKLFQLARIRLLASDDGFAQDQRVLVDFTDEEMHGSWGAPGHAPQVYAFDGLDARAQELRLILTPRPGTAVYVAEVELRGSGEGLAELAAANADGRTGYVFDAAHCADLDGDGAEETLLGSSNGKVYCLGADGKVRWIADCGQPINSVTTVDFAGNDRPSVVAGTMNSLVVAISGDGEVQWTYEVPYYKRTPHVRTVFAADLGGEGREIAVAGADNWRYHAIDGAGHKLWHYESVHGSTAGAAADLDGDGRDEVIAGTEYYTWHVINADGSRRWGARTAGGPCANAAAAGDVDGDGTLEVIFGGADSNVHTWGDDGKLRWLFNTGDEVTGVVCADVDGDGADEILVSSLSFNVYCLDGDGALLWRSPLPNEAVSLALLQGDDGLRIAAGCSDGAVYLLDAGDGAIRGRFDAGAKVLALASRGGRDIIATTADGRARAISAPE